MRQQGQKVTSPTPVRNTVASRGPFPWLRVIIAFGLFLVLGFLAVVGLLATGRIIDSTWLYLVPVLTGLIVAMIPVLQWLFPVNPLGQASLPQPAPAPSPPASPVSSHGAGVPPISTSAVSAFLAPPPAENVFHFNEVHLPSIDEFYARAYERQTVIDRINKRSSTALVGEYRSGKSWLMQYVQQRIAVYQQPGVQVRVGKFSATNAMCQTVPGFVGCALEVLDMTDYKTSVHETPLGSLTLAIRSLKKLNIIPVLCIDEFAGLIGKTGFDTEFLEGLRAIAEDEGLVLITASRDALHKVIEYITGRTSPLFNIMPELVLQPFSEEEARAFLVEKGQQANLSQEEQELCLKCAAIFGPDGVPGWPPMRLQLVGHLLFADKYPPGAGQRIYQPGDVAYRAEFKLRLDKQYQAVV